MPESLQLAPHGAVVNRRPDSRDRSAEDSRIGLELRFDFLASRTRQVVLYITAAGRA